MVVSEYLDGLVENQKRLNELRSNGGYTKEELATLEDLDTYDDDITRALEEKESGDMLIVYSDGTMETVDNGKA